MERSTDITKNDKRTEDGASFRAKENIPTVFWEDVDDLASETTKEETDRASPTSVVEYEVHSNVIDKLTREKETLLEEKAAMAKRVEELEAAIEAAAAQKTRMVANMKKKKAALAAAEARITSIEPKVGDLEGRLGDLEAENGSLRAGLQKVAAVRDDYKNKLRVQQDLLKETRHEKDEMQKLLKKSEAQRALEQALLDNYRALSIHTGYYKWGKEIRLLETKLEASNKSDD